jgi:MFS family permease
LASDFKVGPAESSLSLSLATGLLAVAILCAAVLSEGVRRRSLMFVSMAAAAALNVAAAAAPSWPALLVVQALEGFALGGLPAVAMAYLAEEIDPRGLGYTMGLHVAGTALGGMTGRVGTGAECLFVIASRLTSLHGRTINEFGLAYRLPVFGSWRETAAGGGLMTYGPNRLEQARQLAR